mgnify:CR=1 FL=1
MKQVKKRTLPQQQQEEVDSIVHQVKEWVKEHPTGNIVNLSTNPKLKKAFDDSFLENWDAKKKRRIYMQYNGFMSFVYHFITNEHKILISDGNRFTIDEIAGELFPKENKLSNEEYDAFLKIFLPLLNHLTANYRLDTESVLSLKDHITHFKGEKFDRDGFFATDDTLLPRMVTILKTIFTTDFEAFKNKPNKQLFISWDLACWMTCNVKHTFSYDIIICDASANYTLLQDSLVNSLKVQNPSVKIILTTLYTNKRVKNT